MLRSVIAVLILLCASALAYSMWPSPPSGPLVPEESDASNGQESPTESAPSSGSIEVEKAEFAQRSEVDPLAPDSVRRILVLDPDGNPVAGERLHFRLEGAEAAGLPYFMKKLESGSKLRPEQAFHRANVVLTNQDGIAEIPADGVGTIGMRTSQWQGARVFGLFDPSEREPIQLQLAPFQCIEVQVVTDSGAPAHGVAVCMARSTAESRAREEAHASSPERSRRRVEPAIMSFMAHRETNEEGIVRFDAEFEQGQIDYHQLKDEGTVLYVQADLPLSSSVRKEVSYGESTQVRLVLPPMGGVRVELVNYPALIVPKLHAVDRSAPFRRTPQVKLQSDTMGTRTYEIPQIGLGVQIRVALHRELSDGSRTSTRGTNYPGLDFAGPTSPGEWIDVRLEFDQSASLIGTLVDSRGEPIAADFDDLSEISLYGSTADPAMGPLEIPVEVDREGKMVASLPAHNPSQLSWQDFTELCLLRLPSHRGFYSENMELPQPEWALLPVPLPTQTAPIDLGTIRIGSENPPLVVQIVDHLTGDAIPQAQLTFQYAGVGADGETGDWETSRVTRLLRARSSESGTFNLPGSRTSSLLVSPSTVQGSAGSRYRLKVEHQDYVASEVEFSIEDTHLTVSLKRAYSLTGQVRAPAGLESVQLQMIPAGCDLSAHTGRSGRAGVPLLNRGVQADGSSLVDFEINTLEPGLQDLVVTLGQNDEVTRIRGIDPSVINVLEDVLDLRGLVQFARFALIDKDGNQLRSKHAGVNLMAVSDRGISGRTACWDGDWVIIPLAPAARFIGVIQVPGYRSVTLDDFGPGDHRVQLGGMREARIRYVPGRELPEGATIKADWIPRRTPDPTIGLEVQGEEDQRISVGAAPTFRVRWWLHDADGTRIGYFTSDVKLTEAMLESGEIIDIPVPEELFTQ